MTPKEHFMHIDGLRAIAVLIVFGFHLDSTYFSGGFIGVDVFFVISGFLITRIIISEFERTGRFNFVRFLMRRIRRLFPAMIVVLFITLLFATLLFSPVHLKETGLSITSAVIGVSNIIFWFKADYFAHDAFVKPALHTWSLSVEQQFYLFWPLLLLIVSHLSKLKYCFYFVFIITFGSLFLNVLFAQFLIDIQRLGGAETMFFWMPFRVYEFGLGALVVWLYRYRPRSDLGLSMLALIGIGAIVVATVRFSEETLFPSYNALLPCMGAAFLILGGGGTSTRLLLENRFMRGIGAISYSFYLVHWPIIVFYQYYVFRSLEPLDVTIIIFGTLIFSWLLFTYIETPFRVGRDNLVSQIASKWRVIASTAAFTVIGLGLAAWVSNGWPTRIPHISGQIGEFIYAGDIEGEFHLKYHGGGACKEDCRAGKGPLKLLLVGDSHARHYHTGIEGQIVDSGMSFQTLDQGSCLFRKQLCERLERRMLEVLSKQSLDTVIISQRWDYYKHIGRHFNTSRLGISIEQLADYYVKSIRDRFSSDAYNGIQKIIVIGAVPQLSAIDGLITCFTRPAMVSSPDTGACHQANISNFDELVYRQRLNQVFREALANIDIPEKTIVFWDPFDALCDNNICKQVKDGQLLYSDDDHLSIYGSRVVISHFWSNNNSF